MAFKYEDGTGFDDATSGVDITYLDDYLTTRLIECCEDTQNIKEANLVKGTDYITPEYNSKLLGTKKVSTQRLLFPRVDDDGVEINDDNYKQAICILAIESFNLEDEKLRVNADKRVTKEKLDVIEVEYDEYSSDTTKYNDVAMLMKPYLISDSSSYSYNIVR